MRLSSLRFAGLAAGLAAFMVSCSRQPGKPPASAATGESAHNTPSPTEPQQPAPDQKGAETVPRQPKPNVFPQMRAAALNWRHPADLPSIVDDPSVSGLVVDWFLDNGSIATFCFLGEGSVSMYLSVGGGVIGAGEHEAVRRASAAAIREAIRVQGAMDAVDSAPLPAEGCFRFTLLTSAGLRSVERPADQLRKKDDELNGLLNAVQVAIGEIRVHAPASKSRSPGN